MKALTLLTEASRMGPRMPPFGSNPPERRNCLKVGWSLRNLAWDQTDSLTLRRMAVARMKENTP